MQTLTSQDNRCFHAEWFLFTNWIIAAASHHGLHTHQGGSVALKLCCWAQCRDVHTVRRFKCCKEVFALIAALPLLTFFRRIIFYGLYYGHSLTSKKKRKLLSSAFLLCTPKGFVETGLQGNAFPCCRQWKWDVRHVLNIAYCKAKNQASSSSKCYTEWSGPLYPIFVQNCSKNRAVVSVRYFSF